MKTLFLDTSSFFVTVSIVENDQIVKKNRTKNDNKLSDRIFDIIESVFKEADMKPKEIERIFVVNGPGSFTGIRIGITIAKTMASSLKIPVFKISTLELMCSGSDKDCVSVIKDRNDFAYTGEYDKDLNILREDRFCPIDEVDFSKPIYTYDDYDFDTLEPTIDLIKIIKKHEKDNKINPHLLAPNYLKDTEAEKKFR